MSRPPTSRTTDTPLDAALEAALVRQLHRAWHELNAAHFRSRLQPPTLALSDAGGRLGQWVRATRTLELGRHFAIAHSWGVVMEVLKHEMAHQFVDEVLGQPDDTAHGPAFRALCEKLGIDASAAGLPRGDAAVADDAEKRALERVAKLLALAESANAHEAELAMAEAQRLMLKHNLGVTARATYSFRHLGTPTGRVTESERLLANILQDHFFVETIWVPVWRVHEGKRGSVLEVCGSPVNLELAAYAHAFLTQTAERLWREYKRAHRLASNRDRRTYLAGVMIGFREKLEAQRKRNAAEGLVWVGDGDLRRYWKRRHPHVRWTRSNGVHENEAHTHGRAAGRNIVLHRAITAAGNGGRLLPGRR